MTGNACIAESHASTAHPLYYNIDRTEKRYMVTDGQTTQLMQLRDNKILEQGEGNINSKELIFVGDENITVPLKNNTDINDINAVRYQLEGINDDQIKKIGKFIDQFIIVTPEQRSAYKEYKKNNDFQKALYAQQMKSKVIKNR